MLDEFEQTYENLDDAPVVIVDADCKDVSDALKEKSLKSIPRSPFGNSPSVPLSARMRAPVLSA